MLDAPGYAACAVLLALSLTDLRARRLPNPLVAAFGVLYAVHAWSVATPWTVLVQHIATAFAGFALGACLHAAGRLGGGDVKLASALLLWVGAHGAMPMFVLVSLAGLVVALVGLAVDRFVPALPFARLWSARRGVPYGVALAIGGWCALLPRTWLPG
ncbi:A24 family peptidase [Trinickia fusca]|uniref:Prepilin type IV endopeptidase peptidase domain-containing protein n=1 Tax=Trinickia fusca TaxID=2419777 RepID=A0A494XR46_9BURK|nr:prepilin peptidase [Trinickia fusca]RKP50609.1 hypothetical protein D7S89_05775 [Trinickia fusca]